MTIQPIPPSLKNSPFRFLEDDTLRYTFEYLTIQERAKASSTCQDLNERTMRPFNDRIIRRSVGEVITFCERFAPGIQLQEIKNLFEQFNSPSSSNFLTRQVSLNALQDEIFSLEMRAIRIFGRFDLRSLEVFVVNKVAPTKWPSVFPVSKAFARMFFFQLEIQPLTKMRHWKDCQEAALLSLAGKESEIFVRAWKKEGGNSLLGETSDTFIERVAKKAISNKDYRAARNLAKIAKGYLFKLVISQVADKYEKNPKVSKAPLHSRQYHSGTSFLGHKRRSVQVGSRVKILDALSKELARKEKERAISNIKEVYFIEL